MDPCLSASARHEILRPCLGDCSCAALHNGAQRPQQHKDPRNRRDFFTSSLFGPTWSSKMAKIMAPILPIVFILRYWVIVWGSFGGPGIGINMRDPQVSVVFGAHVKQEDVARSSSSPTSGTSRSSARPAALIRWTCGKAWLKWSL